MTANTKDTICASATPSGPGAIAVIRVSGPRALTVTDRIFHGQNLDKAKSHTIHFGTVRDGDTVIDEVLVSVFKNPRSYTGEDVAEISCHGSPYIKQAVINLLIKHGARAASPGEFTLRAFLNGKMDLSRAEAVADLIASESRASHETAMNQMRGDFGKEIEKLRAELIEFASLMELELDFSEEDVEFADREKLRELLIKIHTTTRNLIESYSVGNVLKDGVPVVIAGKPNAGKSTLLNRLLKEDRAIVSAVEGTTRDAIEDTAVFNGIAFRFIDTAGIRETADEVEAIGVKRTLEKMKTAAVVLYLFDVNIFSREELERVREELSASARGNRARLILVGNKTDLADRKELEERFRGLEELYYISAEKRENIEVLIGRLVELIETRRVSSGDILVSNTRHHEALTKADEALINALNGLDTGITGDFIAMDIRQALHHLGEITGEISTDDLLDSIFSNFCIGK